MKPSCKHNHLSDLCEICNSSPISKETQQDTDTWSEGGTEYRKREGFIEAKNTLNPDWIVVDKDGSTNGSPAALEVIQFYANPDNWVTPSKGFAARYDPEPSPVKADRGEKAREFLRINGLDTPLSASADHEVGVARSRSALGRPITETTPIGASYRWSMGGIFTRISTGWTWSLRNERDVFAILPAGGEWWPND